jgi:S-adenosylmethionine hydrolase
MPVVTFLSDFGTADGFTAAMKGVVLQRAPGAQLVDATHEIVPGDVEAGAWALREYWELYPAGSVHVAVVDPEVGGARKAIAVAAGGRYVVAPDNGLVTWVVRGAQSWRCVEILARIAGREPSATFHGRDIFAPAAAHLALGHELETLGPPVAAPRLLAIEPPQRLTRELRGRVAHVDRFGNLITDLPADWVDESWSFSVAGREVGRLRRAYSDAQPGELVVVIGSLGTVEIAARDASAAHLVGAARGAPVAARR